jgi:hypothetical protein
MQIKIHQKAKKVLIVILVLTLTAIVVLALRPAQFPKDQVVETAPATDSQAAVDAVTAFYTLDYTESQDLWAARVCAHATEEGCTIVRSFFAPAMQDLLHENFIQTGCTALPVQLVEETGVTRIWQVEATLDHPWIGLNAQTQMVFVEMAQEDGQWLMNRILFEQETDRLNTATP